MPSIVVMLEVRHDGYVTYPMVHVDESMIPLEEEELARVAVALLRAMTGMAEPTYASVQSWDSTHVQAETDVVPPYVSVHYTSEEVKQAGFTPSAFQQLLTEYANRLLAENK